MSLDDIPKKVQYVIIDSNFVNGTNNTFSLDLTLKSNTHVEDMSRVLGIKMVDFYITQVGDNDSKLSPNIAKFVDIICPEIPKVAQILDERHGQIFARVPLRDILVEVMMPYSVINSGEAFIVRQTTLTPFLSKS